MGPIRSYMVLAICAYLAVRPDLGLAADEPVAIAGSTPIAAGRSVEAPKSMQNNDNGVLETEENVTVSSSVLDSGSSEPFLCEFSLEKENSRVRWVNSGSHYPRLTPPFTKRELLMRPFSRTQQGQSASWGACGEGEESSRPNEIIVTLFAHAATSKTVPNGDAERCRWTSAGTMVSAKRRFRVKIGQWIGIEFKTLVGERKRISLHWTKKPQPDTSGRYCRKFAARMNRNNFNSNGFRLLQLKAGNRNAERRGPSSESITSGMPDGIG